MRAGINLCALALLIASCAGEPARRDAANDYLRYVGFELAFGENVTLHWSRAQMPLRVFLPPPPNGFYEDSVAVLDVVRDSFTDWADVVEPGLPSFVLVESAREADIPVVWALTAPDPTWYIAHCAYGDTLGAKRLSISRILVTARWDGQEPPLDVLYGTVLHEVGHALGLGDHSPDPHDVMFSGARMGRALTARDRATLRALYARPNGHRLTGPKRVD